MPSEKINITHGLINTYLNSNAMFVTRFRDMSLCEGQYLISCSAVGYGEAQLSDLLQGVHALACAVLL